VASYYDYFLPQVLPAFLLTYSPIYLIHFPLYGSGFLTALILEAKKPTCCLSIQLTIIVFFKAGSASTFTQAGETKSTL